MVTKMGPCGGNGGSRRDMDTNGVNRIVRVIVHSGHTIDFVSVLYERNGREEWTDKWGGRGGGRNEIRLGTDEYFTSVRGHVGQFNGVAAVVRSLTFVSNHRTFGPYGREQGTPFTLPAVDGQVVGFHARSGLFLDAFGTYVKPRAATAYCAECERYSQEEEGGCSCSCSGSSDSE